MVTAVSGVAKIEVTATQQDTLDLGTTSFPLNDEAAELFTFANGILANQINEMFSDQRTLADGVSEEIDLSGSLTNALGTSIVFNAVKVLQIIIKSGVANLKVGGAAANGWVTMFDDPTDKLIVRGGGGGFLIFAPDVIGYDVTAATADLLKIEHDGSDSADIVYNIYIGGIKTP